MTIEREARAACHWICGCKAERIALGRTEK
jgi:hypothetical protein